MVNLTVRNTIPKSKKKPRSTLDSDNRVERNKVYNTQAWKKLRKAKLMEQPLCEVCLQFGKYTPAEHIHHLDSFINYHGELRQYKAMDYNNLCSICNHCHGTYHSICEQNGIKPNHTVEEIAQIIRNQKIYKDVRYEEKRTRL